MQKDIAVLNKTAKNHDASVATQMVGGILVAVGAGTIGGTFFPGQDITPPLAYAAQQGGVVSVVIGSLMLISAHAVTTLLKNRQQRQQEIFVGSYGSPEEQKDVAQWSTSLRKRTLVSTVSVGLSAAAVLSALNAPTLSSVVGAGVVTIASVLAGVAHTHKEETAQAEKRAHLVAKIAARRNLTTVFRKSSPA